MRKNVYNIVWADDEIDDLLDKDTIKELEANGFKIVGKAHDGEELESLLKKPELVDAVIVDANFNESDNEIFSERDTSGLDYARGLYLHTLKQRVPFFLFTNRSDELLRDIYKHNPKFLEDFPRHKRWFNKSVQGEYDELFEAIKNTVTEMNSPYFILRNKFSNEFEAAKLIPNAENLLFCGLRSEFSDFSTNDAIIESFNPVRMLCENIIDKCQEKGYVPYLSSLNSICDFLELKEVEGFKLRVPIMHKTLIRSLDYFLSITQDGSHDKSDLPLEVIDYVRSRRNDSLYKSILYIVMDLLLWYKELLDVIPDPSGLWTGTYEAKGKVCAVMNGDRLVYTINGEYQIEDNGMLYDGAELFILKSHPNRHPFGSIKKFVFKTNYKIKKHQCK